MPTDFRTETVNSALGKIRHYERACEIFTINFHLLHLGSFEVRINQKLVFSKLQSQCFPYVDDVSYSIFLTKSVVSRSNVFIHGVVSIFS